MGVGVGELMGVWVCGCGCGCVGVGVGVGGVRACVQRFAGWVLGGK